MEIKNSEIEYAAKLLLDDELAFYDNREEKEGERAIVLKSLSSNNILACPGSGKTTTLLAKLIILGNKLDFKEGRGVCVFTHTNVAIDKIKQELGAKSDILFSYPNYFGTIQSFINKYLATPNFVRKNGFRPSIRNDFYYDAVRRKYKTGILSSLWTVLDFRTRHNGLTHADFIGSLRFSYADREVISTGLLSDEPWIGLQSDSYTKVKEFKSEIYKEGFLCYDDAYIEAKEYIDSYPRVIEAIRNRFQFVFADEMQDSGSHQLDILEGLFKDQENVIYQCFGDANQAIYSDGNNEGGWSPSLADSLQISQTKRFSSNICSSINELRINKTNEAPNITSGSVHTSRQCKIILFSENNVGNVIEKYAEIIDLESCPNDDKFYAIGRISKAPGGGQFSIKSYFPDFERRKSNGLRFDNLEAHIWHSRNTSLSVKDRYAIIINALLVILEINELKNEDTGRKYTKRTMFKHIENEDEDKAAELKENISRWIKSKLTEQDNLQSIKTDIIDYFGQYIDDIWDVQIDPNKEFMTGLFVPPENDEEMVNRKMYNVNGNSNVEILINTINGEKGRTHSATLFLETFKNTYDVEKMLNYIAGEEIKRNVRGANVGKVKLSPSQQLQVKFAYVGMSRAKHLLCVAVREGVVDDDMRQKLTDNGWSINDDLVN